MKIIERRLGKAKGASRKLESTKVVSAQGKRVSAPMVDADSRSFGQDLLESFAKSVERVRRENKLLFGHRDRIDDQ